MCGKLQNPFEANIVHINTVQSEYRRGVSKRNIEYGTIMAPPYKPHQTVTRKGCIGFRKTTCGFSEMSFIQKKNFFFYKIEVIVQFSVGDVSPGCPGLSTTNENIEPVKKMILDNLRIIIKEVTDDFCISFDPCQAIFNDVFGMKRAIAKIVPKLLNFRQ